MTWKSQSVCLLACLPAWAGPAQTGSAAPPPKTGAAAGDYVVLLHGMGRTAFSMKRMEWAFKKQGYRVVNVSYPSTRQPVETLAEQYLGKLLREQTPDPHRRIHFVTHSLGGIVLRQYLANHRLENLGRVVMLAPPNGGSEVADKLKRNWLYRWSTGPSGQQLGTSGLPTRLPPADFEVGVLAGDRSFNVLSSWWVRGPDDGKVSVRNTQLAGMKDFAVVHSSHTWLMWRGQVIEKALAFVKDGIL